jgi:hypothetical protein
MKKYDLSKVMKRAWEIKKQDAKNIFAICLKMAWEEIKKGVVKMVELIGSEKQVAWATEIRNDNIKTLEREIEDLKSREVNGTGSFPELVAKLEKALNELKNDTTHIYASWWIEHKGLARVFIQSAKKH